MSANTMIVTGIIGMQKTDDEGNVLVDNTAQGLVSRFESLVAANPLEVTVGFRTCYGGSVYEGLPLANAMLEARKKGTRVITVVEGLAASMASFCFVHGDVRKIDRVSRIMVHPVKSGPFGTWQDIQAEADNLKSLSEDIINRYAECTGKTPEFVAANWCDGPDREFGAKYCLDNGIATEIIESDLVPATALKIKGDNAEMLATAIQKVMLHVQPDTNTDMKYNEATKLALGLPADATDAAVDTFLADAKQAKADLATMQAAKVTAEAAEKEALIDTAATEGKILPGKTAEMKAIVKDLPLDSVKTMVANMQKHVPLTERINAGGGSTAADTATELATLSAQSGKDLFESNKLMRLKELDEPTFQAKYKELFKTEYKG